MPTAGRVVAGLLTVLLDVQSQETFGQGSWHGLETGYNYRDENIRR